MPGLFLPVTRTVILAPPVVVAAGAGAIFGQDDFTGTDADPLTGRTATTGGTWTEHTSYSSGDMLISNANRLRSSGTACFHLPATPASADYDVSAGLVMKSDNNSGHFAVAGRINTAENTLYYAGYTTSGNIWFLNKIVAGVISNVAAGVGATLNVDQEYTAKLQMRGTSIKLFVDGVETISGTDGDISATGVAGIRAQGTNSSTLGMNLDNFLAQDA